MIRCIIIEDEEHAAAYLSRQLKTCSDKIEIQAIIDSIEDAVKWLSLNETDLIFADIQIGDGLSFEIFDHITVLTPVIFTTSYHHYAIKAFEQNSIAYLLKPIKQQELARSIEKYQSLYQDTELSARKLATLNEQYLDKFVVNTGHVFQSIRQSEIAFFRLQDKRYLFIHTKDNRTFMYDSSLEHLESRLDPNVFFRINRQYIINKTIINKTKQIERGRFVIQHPLDHKEELIVSIGRAKDFKQWFEQ